MEPNQTAQTVKSTPGEDIVFRDVDKKRKGMIIGMICLAILAAGGIGFGVWAMMDGNAQKEQLNLQVADLKAQNSELMGRVSNDENTDIDNASNENNFGPYMNDGYFYVPEWKLKFKIPEDLTNYGYSVDYDQAHVGYTLPSIGFTAMLKDDFQENAQSVYYDNIATCSIVTVTKEPSDWNKWDIDGKIVSIDDYKLLIWNSSHHGSCDFDLHKDVVEEKIQTMFSNPEEY